MLRLIVIATIALTGSVAAARSDELSRPGAGFLSTV